MAEILSVSITREQKEWLENTGASPSELMQDSIKAMMGSNKALIQRIKGMESNIQGLQAEIAKRQQIIDDLNHVL